MHFVVIGISGKAQSGKTTTNELIREILNDDENFRRYKIEYTPFAKKLKDIAADLFGWDGDKTLYKIREDVHYFGVDNGPLKPGRPSFDTVVERVDESRGRGLLIALGQYMRKIKPLVWAEYVKNKIIKMNMDPINDKTIYIVDDIRFVNEMQALSIFGKKFLSIRLTRKSQLSIDDVSENDLDNFTNFDHFIVNDGTREELKAKLVPIVTEAIIRSKGFVHA